MKNVQPTFRVMWVHPAKPNEDDVCGGVDEPSAHRGRRVRRDAGHREQSVERNR